MHAQLEIEKTLITRKRKGQRQSKDQRQRSKVKDDIKDRWSRTDKWSKTKIKDKGQRQRSKVEKIKYMKLKFSPGENSFKNHLSTLKTLLFP